MLFWAITATAAIGLVSLYRIGILSPLNAGWCAAIVILAVYAERHWGAGRRKLIQELEYSIQEIRQVGVQLSVEELAAADRFFAHSPLLEELWRRYKVYADSGSRLPDPRDFFSRSALCQQDAGNRFARLVPGALTGLGILGTFFGLVLGLYQMNLDTTEALRRSIHTITSGMQTAFITSIAGILFSLAYSYDDQQLDNKVLAAISKFQEAISSMVPHTTEYSLLERLVVTQEKQLEQFQTFASDVLIPEIVNRLGKAISEAVEPYMAQTAKVFEEFTEGSSRVQIEGMTKMAERFNASLNEATQEQLDALRRTIQETVEWQKATRDELKALVGELIAGAEEQRKNLAVSLELVERIQAQVPVCERLQGLLGRLSEDMAQSAAAMSSVAPNVMELHRSTEEMAKMHGELEEHLSELVGEVADSVRTQQETISSSLELASKLQSQVPVFTGLQEALAGLAGDVTSSAQSLSDALTNLQAIHGRIGESLAVASQMQEQLSAAQEGYRQGLQQELEEMRRFWGSAARDLRDLQEELSAGIQSFTKQLHGGLEYSLSQFDSLLSDVTGRLGAVISAVRDSVENIPDEMDRVERALSDLGETLEIAVAEFGDRLGANSEVEEQVGVDAEIS